MLILLLACAEPTTFESKAADVAACADTSTSLLDDEPSPLGVSAAGIVAAVGGERTADFVYRDDTLTTLTASFTLVEETAAWVDSEPSPEGEAEECTDSLEFTMAVTFVTADGAFDEAFDVDLAITAWDEEYLNLQIDLPVADHAGTFARDGMERLSIPTNLHPDTWSGEVIAVDDGTDTEDVTTECGIGAWNAELMTDCG